MKDIVSNCQSCSSAGVGSPGTSYVNTWSVCLLLPSGFVQPCYMIATLVCPRALVMIKSSSSSFICHEYKQCVETQGNCGQLLEGLIFIFLT